MTAHRPLVLLAILLLGGGSMARAAAPAPAAAIPSKTGSAADAPAAKTPAPQPSAGSASSGDHVISIFFASPPNTAKPAVRPPAGPPPPHTSPAKDVAAFALVIVAVFLVVWGGVRAARALLRKRSRKCPECGHPMPLLDAAAAYAHLDLAERTEQLVGDVGYEVWACPGCGHVEKRSRVRQVTGSPQVLAPVGSATYLRQQQRDGLSIWTNESPAGETRADGAENGS